MVGRSYFYVDNDGRMGLTVADRVTENLYSSTITVVLLKYNSYQGFHLPIYDWMAFLATKMQMKGFDILHKLYSELNYEFRSNLADNKVCCLLKSKLNYRLEKIPIKVQVQKKMT